MYGIKRFTYVRNESSLLEMGGLTSAPDKTFLGETAHW